MKPCPLDRGESAMQADVMGAGMSAKRRPWAGSGGVVGFGVLGVSG